MADDIFEQLNDALFEQMSKLQSIHPNNGMLMNQTIEQTEAVTAIAERIIQNNNSKVSAMRFFDSVGMRLEEFERQRGKMLGSGE